MAQEVTVLGAGIVGICCALSLVERGVRVRLIDRGDPGQETSFGNAGVISPWSVIPQAVPGLLPKLPGMLFGPRKPVAVRASFWPRMVPWGLRFLRYGTKDRMRRTSDAMEILCAPSVDLYRRHLRGTGHEGLLRDSMYIHAFRIADSAMLDSLDYQIRREKGAEMELVGADELRQIEPALSPDFRAAVLIRGQARALSPGRIGTALANKARGLGVEIIRSEIRALRPSEQGWDIETADGSFHAENAVLAMGAWSAGLLKPLGISIPLVAERGYHLEFPNPGISLENSIMDTDAKFVASSMEGGVRVAGHAEFGDVNAPPDSRREKLLLKQSLAAFPDLRTTTPSFWMGRRPSFPDSLPMLGEFAGKKGLFASFGHSHYGLMMAPKTGELLADLVTGQKTNLDLAAFSTGRFS